MTTETGFWNVLTSIDMVHAAWTTIWIAVASQALGVLLGFVFAGLQMSRWRVPRWIAVAYLWLFRGSPELLQIIAWYAILPFVGVTLDIWQIAILGLGVNEGARMTEVVRGAIVAVDRGQTDAAKVLGMNGFQRFVHVVLPQALVLVIPPLGNQISYMFKSTSLVSTIGVVELLGQTQQLAQFTNNPLPLYLAGAVWYLAITTAWSIAQRWMEGRASFDPRRRIPLLTSLRATLTDLPGRRL